MRLRRGDAALRLRKAGVGKMASRRPAASRGRHLLRVTFVLVAIFAGGLVTAVVVSGAGPLAVLATDDPPPTTETTAGDTTTESGSTESTTTESDTTDASPTESTATDTTTTTTESTEPTAAPTTGPPTIVSDQPDYAPGSTVTLTGTQWVADEAVHLFVNDNVGQTWSYNADLTADSNGTFTHRFQLPATFVSVYSVTATGAASGTAMTSFTDASTLIAAAPSGVSFDLTYQGFQDSA